MKNKNAELKEIDTRYEALRRKYKRKSIGGALGFIAGAVITAMPFVNVFSGAGNQEKPPIVESYEKAEGSLAKLTQSKKSAITSANLPYWSPEFNTKVKSLVDLEKERCEGLEKAMGILDKDLEEMKKDPEFADYMRKINEDSERLFNRSLLGLGIMLLTGVYGLKQATHYGKSFEKQRVERYDIRLQQLEAEE